MQLIHGDCLEEMERLSDNCIDSIFSDPPYPCIKRSYGYWSESDWLKMMQEVVRQSKRILKPKGSVVFILQPNSEHVGQMRLWLWKFIVWAGEEWNIIQDAYWWNFTAMPTTHCSKNNGLMRSSVKYCVWLGNANCYKNQQEILWAESASTAASRLENNSNETERFASGYTVKRKDMLNTSIEKGGVSPFNLLPISPDSNPGMFGHGAGTPLKLTKWWLKYITPSQGIVLDMFSGTGTTGVAAKQLGFDYIGIERVEKYHKIAEFRIRRALSKRALSKSDASSELFIDSDESEEIVIF